VGGMGLSFSLRWRRKTLARWRKPLLTSWWDGRGWRIHHGRCLSTLATPPCIELTPTASPRYLPHQPGATTGLLCPRCIRRHDSTELYLLRSVPRRNAFQFSILSVAKTSRLPHRLPRAPRFVEQHSNWRAVALCLPSAIYFTTRRIQTRTIRMAAARHRRYGPYRAAFQACRPAYTLARPLRRAGAGATTRGVYRNAPPAISRIYGDGRCPTCQVSPPPCAWDGSRVTAGPR